MVCVSSRGCVCVCVIGDVAVWAGGRWKGDRVSGSADARLEAPAARPVHERRLHSQLLEGCAGVSASAISVVWSKADRPLGTTAHPNLQRGDLRAPKASRSTKGDALLADTIRARRRSSEESRGKEEERVRSKKKGRKKERCERCESCRTREENDTC